MKTNKDKTKGFYRIVSGTLIILMVLLLLIPGIKNTMADTQGAENDIVVLSLDRPNDGGAVNDEINDMTANELRDTKEENLDDENSVDEQSTDDNRVDGISGDDNSYDEGVADGNKSEENSDDENSDDENSDERNTDDGNIDKGNTDEGNTDEGNTGEGNTDEGNTDEGNTDEGNTDAGNTSAGNTGTGNTTEENDSEEVDSADTDINDEESEDADVSETGDELDDETDSASEVVGTGSISGFFWVDGDGSIDTDWDGLYNGYEQPLTGFRVFLYAAGELTTVLATTLTDPDGNYSFDNLEPGSYVLEIRGAQVAGIDYLPPVFVTSDNMFAINWSISGLPAYTDTIELTDGQAARGINAGMRLPMGTATYDTVTLSTLGTAKPGDEIIIQGKFWFVIDKKTIGTGPDAINAVYLLLKTPIYSSLRFGATVDYMSSELRARMKKALDDQSNNLQTIHAMALVPDLGNNLWSTTIFTEPTLQMAGSRTEDILFAPSYADMFKFNNNRRTPLNATLYNNYVRFFFRTPDTNGNLYGVIRDGNYIESGLSPVGSTGGIRDVPGVWVNAGAATQDINVFYVDEAGNPIGNPSSKIYTVYYDDSFTLTSADIPEIEGYEYKHWKKGLSGTENTGSFPKETLTTKEIVAGTDVYLVYKRTSADVTVTKTVTGEPINTQASFEFTAYFTDSGETALASGKKFSFEGGTTVSGAVKPQDGELVLDAGGKAVFYLKHGQTITIKGVPIDAKVKIVESHNSSFNASFVDRDDPDSREPNNMELRPIGPDGVKAFDFLNERKDVVPTGISGEAWVMVALPLITAALLITGMAALRLVKRRVM